MIEFELLCVPETEVESAIGGRTRACLERQEVARGRESQVEREEYVFRIGQGRSGTVDTER